MTDKNSKGEPSPGMVTYTLPPTIQQPSSPLIRSFTFSSTASPPVSPGQTRLAHPASPLAQTMFANNSQPMSPPLRSAMKSPALTSGLKSPAFSTNLKSPTFQNGLKSPGVASVLKSPALQTPMTARFAPTVRDESEDGDDIEKDIEKADKDVAKRNAIDTTLKFRVRVAKVFLRSINLGCAIVVMSLVAVSFNIFHATKNLAPRNNLPPWAPGTKLWPQYVVLSISCVTLVLCVGILIGYWRGKKIVEKYAAWSTVFAVSVFLFFIVMWIVAAVTLNSAKQKSNGQDMWGWSCKDNKRKQLFQNDINFNIVCRAQSWSVICAIIEIGVELIAIGVYCLAFWRISSKEKLRKSMKARDEHRHSLYLKKLRDQSNPNTPYTATFSVKGDSALYNDETRMIHAQAYDPSRPDVDEAVVDPSVVPQQASYDPSHAPSVPTMMRPPTGKKSAPQSPQAEESYPFPSNTGFVPVGPMSPGPMSAGFGGVSGEIGSHMIVKPNAQSQAK